MVLGLFALAATLGASSKALWLDEAYTVHRSAVPIARVLEINRSAEGSPPAYFLLMHFWLELGRSPLIVRGPSILFALISLWLVYQLGVQLADEAVGLLATALLALSSVQLYFAHEARPYALALMLSLLSARIGLQLLLGDRPPTRGRWAAWVLYSSLATYTLYYAWFGVASQVLLGLALLWRRPAERARLRALAARMAPLCVLLLLLYVPELLALEGKLALLKPLAGSGPIKTGIPYPPEATAYPWFERYNRYLSFTAGLQWSRLDSAGLVGALFALAGLLIAGFFAGVWRHHRARPAAALAVLCLTAGPWLLLLGLPFKPHRFEFKHLLITLPWFCLGLALLARARPRLLGWAPLALFAACNLASDYQLLIEQEKEHWPQAVAILAEQAAPGDLLLIKPAYTRIPLGYRAAERGLALRPLYATDSTAPAVLSVRPREGAPYFLAARASGYAPFLQQAARRRQGIWLLQVWSNVSMPVPPIDGELKALGYRRVDNRSRLLPGYAGSNATLIQISHWRR